MSMGNTLDLPPSRSTLSQAVDQDGSVDAIELVEVHLQPETTHLTHNPQQKKETAHVTLNLTHLTLNPQP